MYTADELLVEAQRELDTQKKAAELPTEMYDATSDSLDRLA